MIPADPARWRLLGVAAGLVVVALLSACQPSDRSGPTSPPPGQLTINLDGRDVSLGNGACTWYEDSGQLFVEAGDSEAADYALLAAPLQWLGEELPEGPGADPELSLRVGGTELAVEQASLEGTMNAAQTNGTFMGRLADGRPISGEWACAEVFEG